LYLPEVYHNRFGGEFDQFFPTITCKTRIAKNQLFILLYG